MKKWFLSFLCIAAAVAVCVLLANRAARAEHRVTELYAAAMDEACEALGEIELSLEKLLLSADDAQQAALLSRVSLAGERVLHSLASLPLSQASAEPTLAFVGRISGYADALMAAVVAEGPLPEHERAQLQEELSACRLLAGELQLSRHSVLSADAPLTFSADAYPVAVYQGRYGAVLPIVSREEEPELTQEEAAAAARRLFAAENVVSVTYQRTTQGTLAAHEVTIELPDCTLDAALTVRGGHLLWLMPRTAAFAPLLSGEDCTDAAQQFLLGHGFAPMTQVWQEQYSGLCVVTFAARQQETVLYADLVHVQVRMDTGAVVGLDASQYLLHHAPRQLPSPVLSAAQAASLLAPGLTADRRQLCLLPLYGEERLCYEFRVANEGESYLIFLDAQTGREVLIQKLVLTDTGTLPA